MTSTTKAPPPANPPASVDGAQATNFIKDLIEDDNRTGKHKGNVVTRFPPEPNGLRSCTNFWPFFSSTPRSEYA